MLDPRSSGTPEQPASGPYPGHRVLAVFPVYNEARKLVKLAPKCRPGLVDEFLALDDGSTDEGPELLRRSGISVLTLQHGGLGAALKRGIAYARERGFDVFVVMAGNDKDDPAEIPRLVQAVIAGHDYVQGSRFLPGGSSPNLPVFRRVAIKLLSFLFRIYAGKSCTDLTNGFRAYRLSLLDDPRIDIDQAWLDNYELEYYIHWKAYELGYSVTEVPVTKAYPAEKGVEYSKIRPFVGWWRMLRPFILLGLRLKK